MVAPTPPPHKTHLDITLEMKRLTQDGYIWPRARQDMLSGPIIRKRMAEDLADVIREAGEFHTVGDEALIALGWSPDQVRRYGEQAMRELQGESPCGNDRTCLEGAA